MNERRIDHITRKRVSEMSPEEMKRELLISEKTGLPNRRAFDEDKPSAFVAMCDVNGLKALNDELGYSAGDILIRRFAEVLVTAGLDAYHDKGDEFLCKGRSYRELHKKLSQAQRLFRDQPFVVFSLGHLTTIPGADFCYGIGTTSDEAELHLKRWKALQKSLTRHFDYSPQRVYEAALYSALEHLTVLFIDEKHFMFTFETAKSASSLGFKCDVVIESRNEGKSAEMVMNLQHKDSRQLVLGGAGGRLTNELYMWTRKKLKRNGPLN
jgi:hypothetical protein